MRRSCPFLLLLLLLAPARAAPAAQPAEPLIGLEVVTPFAPGQVWGAAPPRFMLFEDGQLFVGGSARLASGQLEKDEVKALEAELDALRKGPPLGSSLSFGEGEQRWRLRVGKGKGLDLVASGDPAKAAPPLRPLAAFLLRLASYDHPSLRPFEPTAFAVSAHEGTTSGGCRPWTLPISPSEATGGLRPVPAAAVEAWNPGVFPTAACVGEKRYLVTLRPLLPGEKLNPP